jgi:hypothetical protein
MGALRNFWSRVTDNLALKILAVILSVVAWFVAQEEQTYDSTVVAPVEYLMPEDLVLMNAVPPAQVVIRASGSRAALSKFRDQLREVSVKFVVDLEEAEPGRTVHSFRSLPSGVGQGVTIETISPAEVELIFDEVTTRTFPVVLRTRGRLPPGFVEVSRTLEPDEVTLTGAASELLDLDYLQTAALRLGTMRESQKGPLGLDLRKLHLTPDNPSEVRVDFVVQEAVGDRELGGIEVMMPNELAGWRLEPGACVIKLTGPVPVLDALQKDGLVSASVDGDLSALVSPEDGPLSLPVSDMPGGPDASPAVRIRLNHPRGAEVSVETVKPRAFQLFPPPPVEPEEGPRGPEPEQ